MFFTRIGMIIAHLVFWFSAFRLGMGFLFAFGAPDMENNRIAARRYLGTETTGEAINEATLALVLAVALGVLCEISSKRTKPDERE
jgi:hypothetical protein